MTSQSKRQQLSALKASGKLAGTIKAAMAKWQARRDNRPLTSPTNAPRKVNYVDLLHKRAANRRRPVPLGRTLANHYWDLAKAEHPRRQNWESLTPTTDKLTNGWSINTRDNGKYSSRCTWTHYTYTVEVTSYGMILSPKRLRFRLADESRIINAPKGYGWQKDGLGIKLVKLDYTQADYHPTAEELQGPMLEITRTLRDNYRTRRQEEVKTKRDEKQTQAIIRKANREGLSVCVADSARAGNCYAGTVQWARQHGLNPTRHYSPKQLPAKSNGDTQRVRLVISQALRRHRREMETGQCEVSDHR